MKITKLKEVEGNILKKKKKKRRFGLFGGHISGEIKHFENFQNAIYYNFQSEICSCHFPEGLENIQVNRMEAYTKEYRSTSMLSIDRKRRIVVVANHIGDIHFFKLLPNDEELEHIQSVNCYDVNDDSCKQSNLSTIRPHKTKEMIIFGVSWSIDKKHQGKLFTIQGYSEANNAKVRKILESGERINDLQFLQSLSDHFIVVGRKDSDEEKGGFRVFKNVIGKNGTIIELVSASPELHKGGISSVKTFVTTQNLGERVITSSKSNPEVRIWKLDGTLLFELELLGKESHSGIVIVNQRHFLFPGIYGSVFRVKISEENEVEVERVIERDKRSSTTCCGCSDWIGASNIFVASHGDSKLRFYKVEGVERSIFTDDDESCIFFWKDQRERIRFLSDGDMQHWFQQTEISISRCFSVPSLLLICK